MFRRCPWSIIPPLNNLPSALAAPCASVRRAQPWAEAKGYDTFCPVSPIIPKEQVRACLLSRGLDTAAASVHPAQRPGLVLLLRLLQVASVDALELWLKVDGEERQRGLCELMVFKVPELIAHVSHIMTLEEGDMVLTGTPAGVGRPRTRQHPASRVLVAWTQRRSYINA